MGKSTEKKVKKRVFCVKLISIIFSQNKNVNGFYCKFFYVNKFVLTFIFLSNFKVSGKKIHPKWMDKN